MAKASNDKAVKSREYTVLTGINYPPGDRRARVGDVVTLPDPVAQPLLHAGAIEPADAKARIDAAAAALAAEQQRPAPTVGGDE